MDSTAFAGIVGAAATIIAALLVLIGSLLVAMHRTAKRTDAKADALGEQAAVIVDNVQNSHKTGMRDDLDEMREELLDKFTGLARLVTNHHMAQSAELQQIRTDLSADREESRSDMRAINQRVDETVGRIYRLEQKKED